MKTNHLMMALVLMATLLPRCAAKEDPVMAAPVGTPVVSENRQEF